MKIEVQRLRNLTTGKLHTDLADVYIDIQHLTGAKGIVTDDIPSACRALEPYLRKHATDPRLWDGKHDATHVGDIEIPTMDDAECCATFKTYLALVAQE